MLVELSSPAFKVCERERVSIKFKKGLNVVLGDSHASNSIGKSTALLAIEFAFGGNAYTQCESVRIVGPHDVRFAFKFQDNVYYFIRNTEDKETVKQTFCDYSGEIAIMTKDDFVSRLQKRYDFDIFELSFRNAISSHFRIYGKNNYDERSPLYGGHKQSRQQSIVELMKLFERYEDIKNLEGICSMWNERDSAFNVSRKYGYISSKVTNKTQFDENSNNIRTFKAERDTLLSGDVKFARREAENKKGRDELCSQKLKLSEQLKTLKKKIELIDFGINSGLKPTEADVEALMEFFPDVSYERILEVESYHNKLSKILKSQFVEEKSALIKEVESVKSKLIMVEQQIYELGYSDRYSDEFLSRLSFLDNQISRLEEENQAYLNVLEINKQKTKAAINYEVAVSSSLDLIENTINSKMKEFNDRLYTIKRTSPELKFKSSKNYEFKTPRDDGTGTNYKGLLLYDISLLSTTKLPVIAHDSHLFKNIGDEPVENILNIYSQFDKQIFIAFDKKEACLPKAKEVLENNTVLKLYANGGELYGKPQGLEE